MDQQIRKRLARNLAAAIGLAFITVMGAVNIVAGTEWLIRIGVCDPPEQVWQRLFPWVQSRLVALCLPNGTLIVPNAHETDCGLTSRGA